MQLLLGCALAVLPAAAWTEEAPKEYEIKAVILLNLIRFVEWPASAFPETDSPIRIGILGNDPFGAVLEETIRDETVRGHHLVIRRSRQIDDLKDCHLLFVSRSESPRTAAILDQVGRQPILTVGETDGFARRGGAVNLYLDDRRVRFEINPSIARERHLKVSSQLLRLGRIVDPDDAKER